MPKRVQMSRQHPWRAEHPDAVIVARPSRYGNPFKIGVRTPASWSWEATGPKSYQWRFGWIVAEDRAEAVAYFRDWMTGVLEVGGSRLPRPDLAPLAGRDLACWCPLDEPCHADVLLELANGGTR